MSAAERHHTRQRLAERYGLTVSSDEIFRMAKRIAHGHATLIARQSQDVAHWWLTHEGQPIRLVFDRRRRCILTALPLDDSAAYRAGLADRAIPQRGRPPFSVSPLAETA